MKEPPYMNTRLNPDRIERLRLARGHTQADLAAVLSIPPSAFSRVTKGHTPIDQAAVESIAKTLDCSPELLTTAPPNYLHTRPLLRAYADAPKKTVDQYLADTLLAVEMFQTVGARRLPEIIPTFDGDSNSAYDIEEYAGFVRQAAEVPEGHVRNVTRAAERLGCIVLPLDHELGKHLGMSLYVDGIPVIRVSRPDAIGGIPGDRQRFTVAHELGHIGMHASTPEPKTAEESRVLEKQAHRFAGAFLLPAEEFLADLDHLGGRKTLSTLVKLKERWGVAVKAMVVRLQQLGQIDGDQARSLYKQISARGWNKDEPMHVGNERAAWPISALGLRTSRTDALEQVVTASGFGRSHFAAWTEWDAPEAPDAIVLEFARRS